MLRADESHLDAAIAWSAASVAWTVLASSVAIGAGIATASLLLIAFGAIGTLDAAGSFVLVLHFRHARAHEAISAEHERRALVAIAVAMLVIASATAAESVHRLSAHGHARTSVVGIAVAAASVVVLAVLAGGKHRVGTRIESRALVADSHVSAMGAFLAVVTLAGTVAAGALGWWWVDPLGSFVIATLGAIVASSHLRAA
jgi:divalent metal cation (Fe/Co/Zn/Cd) transporter